MLTIWVACGFTLSDSEAVNVAVPLKSVCSMTVNVAVAVP